MTPYLIPTELIYSPDYGGNGGRFYVSKTGSANSSYDFGMYSSYGQADYWWLRSPGDFGDDDNAFYVDLRGNVNTVTHSYDESGVWYSYGV